MKKAVAWPGVTLVLCLMTTLGLMTTLASAQNAQQIIEKSLQLLEQAPYYSVMVMSGDLGLAQYDFIAPDKLRYQANIEDGLGNQSTASAIQIGTTYWDKFMDGPWRESTVDTSIVEDIDFFAEGTIEDVKALGAYAYADPTNSSKTIACNRYSFNTADESGLYSVITCIESRSGLPIAFDITDETGTLFLFYTYQKPADITPPTTVEIEQ
jgi:hypothetical protein